MRRITWAVLGWTILWIVALWAIDPASTAFGWGPRRLHLQKPPAWVLFEVWAIGFVVLGWIWNRVSAETTEQARRADRFVRRMTRVILGWTALWISLFVAWALDPGVAMIGNGPIDTENLIRHKPAEWELFDTWFLGIVILGVIWLFMRWRSVLRHRSKP